MHSTSIDIFDQTIQKTNLWMKELMDELQTDDQQFAYLALRSVLHALRDRLPKEEAMHFAAQLPLLLGGVYIDGWRLKQKPQRWNRDDFLERVSDTLKPGAGEVDVAYVTQCVFRFLSKKITGGEIEDVMSNLPHDIRELLAA